ncbi:MAG: hypothetical protein RLZZ111_1433 [Planctomycetota bacterium]|jgi:hypothetical protein
MPTMQDTIAIAIATLAAGWLAWVVARRLFAPPCSPPGPEGGDGFVPLEKLTGGKKPGRP